MNTRKRKTIGFFIDWIENPYQCDLFSGIKDRALEKDVNLLTFVGGAIESPRKHEHLRNSIYQLAHKDNIDGLVILSGSVSRFVQRERFSSFIHSYDPLPKVSIGQEIDRIHSILIDNKSGLYKMIVHLIRDHGYRNIAFICGPEGNYDADIRLKIYSETLSEFAFPCNPDLIIPGDFTPQSGVQAVSTLLDKPGRKVDAILASNDDMACGVIEELQRRHISIPKDIAVAGFDDQVSSKIMNPPLSTIYQPTYEIGSKALDMILDIIENKEVPLVAYLPTEPVIRESCGCFSESLSLDSVCMTVKKPDTAGKEPEEFFSCPEKLAESIHSNILHHITGKSGFENENIDLQMEDITGLLYSLSASFKKNDYSPFLLTLKAHLYKTARFNRNKEIIWQVFISVLRSYLLPFLSGAKQQLAEIILHKARLLIDDYSEREYLHNAIKEAQANQIYRDIGEHIVSLESIEDVLEILGINFTRLGIRSCYLSLYEGKDDKDIVFSNSKLLFAFNPGGRVEIGKQGISFPTRKLFPEGIIPEDKPWSLLVESIFFGKNQLGIVLYEPESQMEFTTEIMRRLLLNSAFKGAAFIQQIQNQSQNLEAANSELQNTLYTLQTTQKRLVETKKMAALGGLVAGIAHEINTPIGIGVTAASHLAKETNELVLKINTTGLTKSDLFSYVKMANEAASLILSNLQRSHELIKSFKGIAVDQSSEEKRSFKLKEYIQDILLSLRPRLKRVNHNIHIYCPDDIVLNSYPGAFSQIITNLIINSLIHAFDDDRKGTISIEVKLFENEMVLTYSDNGKGIEKKNIKKIFEPFFTTNRAQGGTGLGLHLIFNIITQTLGGTIECRSKPGEGTKFIIRMPVSK
ncbi:MAG: substrate-binding domain-containing protein [Spirochaetales bacterium]|nr:substrate-binding domain-containing protein [Spirochaetales bacterium]